MSAALSTTERQVAAVFAEALELQTIGLDSDFFELGGDSYLAVNIVVALEMLFDIALPDDLIEEAVTVRAVAAHVDALKVGTR